MSFSLYKYPKVLFLSIIMCICLFYIFHMCPISYVGIGASFSAYTDICVYVCIQCRNTVFVYKCLDLMFHIVYVSIYDIGYMFLCVYICIVCDCVCLHMYGVWFCVSSYELCVILCLYALCMCLYILLCILLRVYRSLYILCRFCFCYSYQFYVHRYRINNFIIIIIIIFLTTVVIINIIFNIVIINTFLIIMIISKTTFIINYIFAITSTINNIISNIIVK